MNRGKIWSSELIEKLKELAIQNKGSNEISCKLNLSRRQVTNKLRNLGILLGRDNSHKHKHEIINCLQCQKEVESLISRKQKFCSQYCNSKFHNKNRKKKLD